MLTLFGLGGGVKLTPLGRKKIFIFKWLMGRLCDLMTFIGNIRGSFWPNLRVISNFFQFLQMSKVKMRPQKTAKNRLFKFWELISQKWLKLWQKVFRGNVRHKIDHLLAPSKNFSDFPKIRKLSFKIGLFLTKKSRFSVNY